MRFTAGIVIYLSLGIMSLLCAEDFLAESQRAPTDAKAVGYSPDEQTSPETYQESYRDRKGPKLKKAKKIPIRQRPVTPYRGFTLVNLAATTSISESTAFDSEPTSDNNSEGDEGIIEVVYAQELLNRSMEATAPMPINYERWYS
mgnify:CR=1 FL=1